MNLDIPLIEFDAGSAVPALFRAAVEARGSEEALVAGMRRMGFAELGSRVNRVAHVLQKLGIERGERVAILGKTSIEYVETFFGALSAGASVVPLPALASPEALRLMLLDSRSRVLFVAAAERGAVEPFLQSLSSLRARIAIGFADSGWQEYERLLGAASDAPLELELDGADEFNVIYSSGTTGVPKGIVHSHAMRLAFTRANAAFGFGPGATNLVSTPLYSNTTMVAWLPSMAFGARNVLMEKFDATEALRLIEAERVTHAMLVPVQYERMLRAPDFERFDLSSLGIKLCTSAPLRADTKREILRRMPGALIEIYGLTEGGVATVLVCNAWPEKLDSVGQPAPGCDVKIIDDDGGELPSGSVGEVVGRSPLMMKGYNDRPDATREMLWHDREGRLFFRSGDVGRLDEQGFLYLLDRKKDVIISGGLNIFASDLESVLLSHPAVAEAAVIGIESAEWGETPVAAVALEPEVAATPEELREWANARLGKSQRLSRVVFVPELPKSPIGKVLKRELKGLFGGAA